MHKKFVIFVFSLLFLQVAEAFTLKIDADGLRNSKGVVQITLYNKDGTIPDEKFTKYYKKKIAKISAKKASVVFSHLPEGRYAVVILHDEDSNGKIKKGFMLPKEGVGFSNFDSISPLNKPNFKKASFLLDRDLTKKIKIIYF